MRGSMRWYSVISTRRSFGLDVEAAARSLEQKLDGVEPDLVLVFLSHHHAAHLEATAAYLLRRFDRAVLMAVTGAGVIADGIEVEGEPAVSMVAAVLPGVELRPFHVTAAEVQYLSTHPAYWHKKLPIPDDADPCFLLFPEPFSCDGEKLSESMDRAWPKASKIGGLASGARHPGQNKLLVHRVVHDRGAIGVAMWGNIEMEPLIASGAMPLGPEFRITKSEGQLALELDGVPALDALERMVGDVPTDVRDAFVSAPVVGVRRAAVDGGFVIRNVVGVDRSRNAVGVALDIFPGDMLRFHIRNPVSAREQLIQLLEPVNRAAGAVVISCIARGEEFFGERNHDANVVHSVFPDMPFGGFFANGELGPVAGRTWTHGYTTVLGLFREKTPSKG